MISAVGIDVDGTLTDGLYYVSNNNDVIKVFNTRDFYAIRILQEASIFPFIITESQDDCIVAQYRRLPDYSKKKLIIYTGVINKFDKISKILLRYSIKWHEFAYIGDAENDLPVIEVAGLSGCPSDAVEAVLGRCKYTCVSKGGKGAVYEFTKHILAFNKKEKK